MVLLVWINLICLDSDVWASRKISNFGTRFGCNWGCWSQLVCYVETCYVTTGQNWRILKKIEIPIVIVLHRGKKRKLESATSCAPFAISAGGHVNWSHTQIRFQLLRFSNAQSYSWISKITIISLLCKQETQTHLQRRQRWSNPESKVHFDFSSHSNVNVSNLVWISIWYCCWPLFIIHVKDTELINAPTCQGGVQTWDCWAESLERGGGTSLSGASKLRSHLPSVSRSVVHFLNTRQCHLPANISTTELPLVLSLSGRYFFFKFPSHDDIMRSSSNHSSIFFLYPLNFKILFIFFNLRVFDFGWKSCDCWMPRILRLEGFSLPPAVRQCRAPVGCAEAVNGAFQWRGGLGAVSEE